ncbi:MAG: folate-binding protein [Rhodospirillales bacterium]
MSPPIYARLPDRGVLVVTGEDARPFLQGLVSNDVTVVALNRAVHAALLTPQGKYLFDFCIAEDGDGRLLLEAERGRLPDLHRRLSLYRLRAKVTLAIDDTLDVYAIIGDGAAAAFELPGMDAGAATPVAGGIVFVDPRLAALGLRAMLPAASGDRVLANRDLHPGDAAEWDRLRLAFGIADGSRDMQIDKSLLLEGGFDRLSGIDFGKGCYVGQELTARTKYRGLIKKRLVPVVVDGPLPAPGTPVLAGDAVVGEVRSGTEGLALALLRIEALERAIAGDAQLKAGAASLRPRIPDWMNG